MMIYLSSDKPKTATEKDLDATCRDNDRVWIRTSSGSYYVAYSDGCGGVRYEDIKQAVDEEKEGYCSALKTRAGKRKYSYDQEQIVTV